MPTRKIQPDVILESVKLRIIVRVYLHNKDMIVDTLSPKASMITLNYFFVDASKHRSRVNQLDFIGAFLQAYVKHIFLVKLDSQIRLLSRSEEA